MPDCKVQHCARCLCYLVSNNSKILDSHVLAVILKPLELLGRRLRAPDSFRE